MQAGRWARSNAPFFADVRRQCCQDPVGQKPEMWHHGDDVPSWQRCAFDLIYCIGYRLWQTSPSSWEDGHRAGLDERFLVARTYQEAS